MLWRLITWSKYSLSTISCFTSYFSISFYPAIRSLYTYCYLRSMYVNIARFTLISYHTSVHQGWRWPTWRNIMVDFTTSQQGRFICIINLKQLKTCFLALSNGLKVQGARVPPNHGNIPWLLQEEVVKYQLQGANGVEVPPAPFLTEFSFKLLEMSDWFDWQDNGLKWSHFIFLVLIINFVL